MTFVLPQAYKTKFYYRVYITETVYFKEPVALNVSSVVNPGKFVMNNGVDRFIGTPYIHYENKGSKVIDSPFTQVI